jgi:hypothetical protein
MASVPLQVRIGSEVDLSGFRVLGSVLNALKYQIGAVFGMAGLQRAFQAAIHSARAQAQLEQVLRNNRTASESLKRALLEQAEALQRLTGVDNEAVMGVQTLLLSLNATAEQTLQLTPLVLDLAAAMQTDARMAARLLAQALDGEVIRIGRLNIEARNFNELIAQLNARVRGQAAAMFAAEGGMGRFRVELDELIKAVGRLVAPAGNRLMGGLAQLMNQLTGALDGMRPVLRELVVLLKEAALIMGTLTLTQIPRLIASLGGLLVSARTLITGLQATLMASPYARIFLLSGPAIMTALDEFYRAVSAQFDRAAAAERLRDIQKQLLEKFGVTSAAQLRMLREEGAFGAPERPEPIAAPVTKRKTTLPELEPERLGLSWTARGGFLTIGETQLLQQQTNWARDSAISLRSIMALLQRHLPRFQEEVI